MKEIVRIYFKDPSTGREKSESNPNKIAKALSNPTDEIDLDYNIGENVKIGTSKELIGEIVRIGNMEMEVPVH